MNNLKMIVVVNLRPDRVDLLFTGPLLPAGHAYLYLMISRRF